MDFPIQPYDFVMLLVLLGTTLFGAWKGMAWQLASLASLVLSTVVAIRFGGRLAPFISDAEPWNRFLAMLVLYLGTSLMVWLLFRLVAGALDRVQLKEFDRQAGALFGLLKGLAFCVLITFFAVTLSESARQEILKSFSGKSIAMLIERSGPVMPEDVRTVLGKYIHELDEKLTPDNESVAPETEKFDPNKWLQKLEESDYLLNDASDLQSPARGRGGACWSKNMSPMLLRHDTWLRDPCRCLHAAAARVA